jgi:hypothetical protein
MLPVLGDGDGGALDAVMLLIAELSRLESLWNVIGKRLCVGDGSESAVR